MNNWCICWFFMYPLNAELNPICHLLATIFVVSRLRVKCPLKKTQPSCPGSRDLNWTGKGLKELQIFCTCTLFVTKGMFGSHVTSSTQCGGYSDLIVKQEI